MKKIDGRIPTTGGQYIGMGNNSPDHQRTITRLVIRLQQFDVVPEVPVTVAGKKYIPDLVIFENDKPVVIIEICKVRGYKTDYKKIKKLVDNSKYITEAFVYEYETGFWVRYRQQEGYEESVSESLVLDINLDFNS